MVSFAYFDNGIGYRYVSGPREVMPGEVGFDHVATPAELAAAFPGYILPAELSEESLLAANLQALWVAANDYQVSRIGGSAIGLLTMGVLRALPKSVAVQAWITGIWSLYYVRKGLVTADPLPPDLLDFSIICGPMPYTVPDLMAEVGGA